MRTHPHEPHKPLRHRSTADADADLRARLRASLSDTPVPELEALEGRVLAQWQLRGAQSGATPQGRGGVLAMGGHARQVLAALVIVALVAVLGLQQMQKNSKAALDELAEPDVLSLISLGEL